MKGVRSPSGGNGARTSADPETEGRGGRPVDLGLANDSASPSGLRQVSLARLAEFGIKPKRDLGQNFLIDDNILGVILGQLEWRPEDVVLEIGAGLGVLTVALAQVATHVHAFEVDRSLEGPLNIYDDFSGDKTGCVRQGIISEADDICGMITVKARRIDR